MLPLHSLGTHQACEKGLRLKVKPWGPCGTRHRDTLSSRDERFGAGAEGASCPGSDDTGTGTARATTAEPRQRRQQHGWGAMLGRGRRQ